MIGRPPALPPWLPRRAASGRSETAPTPAKGLNGARLAPWRSRSRDAPRRSIRTRRPGRRHCHWRPRKSRHRRFPRPLAWRWRERRRNRARATPPSRQRRPARRPAWQARARASSFAASPTLNDPAAASAEYSPSEWPATKLASRARSSPASASSTRTTARLAASKAGCAFAVKVSSSCGPSNISKDNFCRERLVDLGQNRAGLRKCLRQGLAHADGLRSLPGKDVSSRHALCPTPYYFEWLRVALRGHPCQAM